MSRRSKAGRGLRRTAVSLLAFWAALLSYGQAVAQDEQPSTPQTLKATVTDRDGRPIEGAQVAWLDWFDTSLDRSIDAVTDVNGEFQIDQRVGKDSSYVIIRKPGYAVSALNMACLPARARMWPMKPVAVKVVDDLADPVAGAIVRAAQVDFDDEFLVADLPAAIAKTTEVVTRNDGWAILRCSRPEDLCSVSVSSDKYGSQTFATDFTQERFHVLQLWQSAPLTLEVLDGDGPAVDWKLAVATDGDTVLGNADPPPRTNPLNGNLLPLGIHFHGTANQEGKLLVSHALIHRPIQFYLVDDKGDLRGSHAVVADGSPDQTVRIVNEPPLKQSGKELTGQFLDSQTKEPVAGVTISIADFRSFPYRSTQATSNERGEFTATLAPAQWNWSIKEKPDGKHVMSGSGATFIIREGGSRLPKLRLLVRDSKIVRGTIRDVDLAIRRARWISVHWEIDGEMHEDRGSFNPDGTFEVEIPADAKLDHCKIVAVGGGNETLTIVSRDPLVLTSEAVDGDDQE